MSTVFLIGNGFDLNCGIKTSYQDAYDGYVKTESNSPLLECFKKEILEREIDTWGDFEVMLLCRYSQSVRLSMTQNV